MAARRSDRSPARKRDRHGRVRLLIPVSARRSRARGIRICFPIRVTARGHDPDLIAAYRVDLPMPRVSAASATVNRSGLELLLVINPPGWRSPADLRRQRPLGQSWRPSFRSDPDDLSYIGGTWRSRLFLTKQRRPHGAGPARPTVRRLGDVIFKQLCPTNVPGRAPPPAPVLADASRSSLGSSSSRSRRTP